MTGAACAAMFFCASAHADLVANGGFETGDFSGWTTALDPSFPSNDSVYDGAPQAGQWAASFGNPNGVSTISQNLVTEAGKTYKVSFWLQNEADVTGASGSNSFGFDWGGMNVISLSDAAGFDYTEYDFFLMATGSSTAITFSFSQTPAFWDFDSVTANVPEPGDLALAGLAGALALLVTARRPRRSSLPGASAA